MENKLILIRHTFTDKSTIGSWYLNRPSGFILCDNLEDKDRGLKKSMSVEETQKIKVYGETCFGYGTYEIEKYNSPKHGMVYLYKDVVGFDFCEIHSANEPKQLLGCQAPGTYTEGKPDWVSNSRNMTKYLYGIIEKYQIKTIEIVKAGAF